VNKGGGTGLDKITLTGVTAVGHHGVFDFERRDGQPFVVDAVLYTDFSKAAETDDLQFTAHYGEVAEYITSLITGEPLNLIEALAVRIAEGILAGFNIDAVDVTVHKPKAPIEVPFGDVTVSVHRERS
jgi:dihydroneopterin aldolase